MDIWFLNCHLLAILIYNLDGQAGKNLSIFNGKTVLLRQKADRFSDFVLIIEYMIKLLSTLEKRKCLEDFDATWKAIWINVYLVREGVKIVS